jgi:DNA-binding transcriptional ArsR family regulator
MKFIATYRVPALGSLDCAISGTPRYSTGWLTIRAFPARLPLMTDPLDLVFSALSDPTRRAILAMLLEDDMAVTDVAEPFAISLAAISKHLTLLAEAGLIAQEKRGRVKWCKLEPDAMRAATVWMQGFGQFDPVDLDGLERFLEQELLAAEQDPVPE